MTCCKCLEESEQALSYAWCIALDNTKLLNNKGNLHPPGLHKPSKMGIYTTAQGSPKIRCHRINRPTDKSDCNRALTRLVYCVVSAQISATEEACLEHRPSLQASCSSSMSLLDRQKCTRAFVLTFAFRTDRTEELMQQQQANCKIEQATSECVWAYAAATGRL